MTNPSERVYLRCPSSGKSAGSVTRYADGTVLIIVRGQSVSVEDPEVLKGLQAMVRDDNASDRH